jgi:hypothetical protein
MAFWISAWNCHRAFSPGDGNASPSRLCVAQYSMGLTLLRNRNTRMRFLRRLGIRAPNQEQQLAQSI